ncbi:MAG: histidine phosphatase family protein [Hyphomicrobiales bacterium]|nr:MAG: histidine phosphatase family protein [Hyphomicrobiales bacterium]
MKIVLMRHGRPLLHLEVMKNERKSAAQTGAVIRDYEFTELDPMQQPPAKSINVANGCAAIFSSPMLRAIGSVQMLGLEEEARVEACFAESAHPYLNWRRPKFNFFTWCFLFRVAWFFGFVQNGEAISLARQRAKTSADKLALAAEQEQAVLLLGHGFMNHLIATKLKQQGWKKISQQAAIIGHISC